MSKEKKVKVSIGLYPKILKLVDDEANRQNRSRSNQIETILKKHFNVEIEEEPNRSIPMVRVR